MEYLGLVFELIFLAIGIFTYRFAVGKIQFHNTQSPLVERFRQENKGWMRLMGLALVAIMSLEIALHIFQLIKK